MSGHPYQQQQQNYAPEPPSSQTSAQPTRPPMQAGVGQHPHPYSSPQYYDHGGTYWGDSQAPRTTSLPPTNQSIQSTSPSNMFGPSPPPGLGPSPSGSFIPMDPSYPLAAQMGLQLGSQAFSAGQEFVHKRVNPWFSRDILRAYFDVNNTYVAAKLLLLLMPFRHKDWQRQMQRSEVSGQIEGFKPPAQDINAPDLYIPSMAIVTYILLVGVSYGLRNSFRPELLGFMASKSLIFIVIELLLVKVGGYVLGVSADISLLEVMAVIGYNYVALVCSLLAGFFGSSIAKYCMFTYCSIAMTFFLLRSLRHAVLPENDRQVSLVPEHRRRRINFLFIIVAAQIVASFFLLV